MPDFFGMGFTARGSTGTAGCSAVIQNEARANQMARIAFGAFARRFAASTIARRILRDSHRS